MPSCEGSFVKVNYKKNVKSAIYDKHYFIWWWFRASGWNSSLRKNYFKERIEGRKQFFFTYM